MGYEQMVYFNSVMNKEANANDITYISYTNLEIRNTFLRTSKKTANENKRNKTKAEEQRQLHKTIPEM